MADTVHLVQVVIETEADGDEHRKEGPGVLWSHTLAWYEYVDRYGRERAMRLLEHHLDGLEWPEPKAE